MSKTAIITGGSQGIGSVLVESFLREGYSVALLDNARESVLKYESVEKLLPIVCDITDDESLQKSIDMVVKEFSGIDCLINNAAISAGKKLCELTRAEWDHVLAVNLTAPFMSVKLCESELRKAKGAVVNIASTRALMSEPDTEAYSASKGGIVALTHALTMSLSPDVRVNAVSPGWIEVSHLRNSSKNNHVVLSNADHQQHPVGRVGEASDVAEMVLFLCSEKAGFITGQNFVVDGGMTKKMIYVP